MARGFVSVASIRSSFVIHRVGFKSPPQILNPLAGHVPYIKWRKTVSSPYPVLVELAEVKPVNSEGQQHVSVCETFHWALCLEDSSWCHSGRSVFILIIGMNTAIYSIDDIVSYLGYCSLC